MNQTKETNTALALAQKYFHSWVNGDFDRAADCLSDKIQFEMPINNYKTKEEFMQAVVFTGKNASNVELLTAMGKNNEAILLYDFTFAPIGRLRIAEHFIVENNAIVFIRHIHDTYQLRKIGMGISA